MRRLEEVQTLNDATLAFIGGGNMAKALIGGLLSRGWSASSIAVADTAVEQREELHSRFPGITVVADSESAIRDRSTWVLAVKPQQLREVALSLSPACRSSRPLVISVAAGIRAGAIRSWLGGTVPVVRSMPNRPALVGAGITGLYGAPDVSAGERERAERVLQSVGATVWVEDEPLIDVVTAVSGSGPAYVFLMIELLEAAGIAEGLDRDTARRLAVETAYGASLMARNLPDSPATLREQVTSKGGTTEAALAVLRSADVAAIYARAVHAARLRAGELADQFG